MLESTQYIFEDGVLIIIPKGALETDQEILAFIEDYANEADRNATRSVLIDASDFTVDISPINIVEIVEELKKRQHHLKEFKVAAINAKDVAMSYLFEIIAADKSMRHRHFENKSDALDWLGGK